MYLKEVIFLGLLALMLLFLNLIAKYYYIFKRGYRISNLILIKLTIRAFSIISFSIMFIWGLDNFNLNIKNNPDYVNYIISVKSTDNNIVLDKNDIINISDLVNSQKEFKASLLIHIEESNKYYLAIPSTSSITFLNLLQSSNLQFDTVSLKILDNQELLKSNYSQVNINSNNKDQIVNYHNDDDNSILNYMNNWSEIPFIKLYLLILTLFFVSFDLFTKFIIIKN